ncbi:MAG TPA: hypothetical protein VFH80_05475 [Solirubrobacteraceae bacterium]|nr:hypothetical protein [Solirubrobacteraceae bacterium]
MSTDSDSFRSGMPSRPSSSVWLHARALWAGVSITIMWLAVLFVGVFGEDIVSSTPGGASTSVPVVVALLPFVLPATIVVARRGFTEVSERPPRAVDEASDTGQILRATRKAG